MDCLFFQKYVLLGPGIEKVHDPQMPKNYTRPNETTRTYLSTFKQIVTQSILNSTSWASLRPDWQSAKWGAGGVAPEGVPEGVKATIVSPC